MSPNTARRIARTLVTAFLLGSLGLSFTHIAHLFEQLGLITAERWLAPAFIDTYMILGKLLTLRCWTPKTRKIGHRVVITGAILSLVANVAAGGSTGGRILGALVVVGFLTGEWLLTVMVPAKPATKKTPTAPKPTPAPAPVAKKATAKRCPAGCTCGKHRRTAKPETELAQIAAGTYPVDAPVSGAATGYAPQIIVATNVREHLTY
jgi:hypothetical protein